MKKENMDSVGIELYSRWRELQLSEITEPIKDTYNPDGSNDFTYIGLEHIEQETLRLNSVGVSSDVTSNKFKFQTNDVLFGKLRPYFRKVVKPQFEGICSTDIWVFRAKQGFDQDFLFYFLANKEFVDTANSGESGSRMPRADWNHLKVTNWNVPPLQEQTAIASILSSLDDKIDLLHRQNKTLEQLAETLFRQWFVEEAEDYELGCFGDVISIFDNLRVPVSSMEREKMKIGKLYPYYGAAKIMDYINDYIFDGEYVLMGEDGTVQTEEGFPILQMPTGKFWVNNHTHVLQAKKPYSNYLIYIFLKQTNINHIITGAVQPKINQENLKLLDFPILPEEKIIDFVKITNDFWEKIKSNQIQIRTLTQTRDTLLPKLMSGEVRLNLDLLDSQDSKDFFNIINQGNQVNPNNQGGDK
ncbi:MAG: restriction endonuclease subunit S [Sphingobacteriales bacterium]|nr:restriction endonuclease subunit S [Sphingobacteriales bacterium]